MSAPTPRRWRVTIRQTMRSTVVVTALTEDRAWEKAEEAYMETGPGFIEHPQHPGMWLIHDPGQFEVDTCKPIAARRSRGGAS